MSRHRLTPIFAPSPHLSSHLPIGAWVLERACRDATAWHQRYGIAVTVNVSGRKLREPGFPQTVLRALRAAGLPGTALILEVTETALIAAGASEADTVIERLGNCAATAYGSLSTTSGRGTPHWRTCGSFRSTY